jgi:hypothetical protein
MCHVGKSEKTPWTKHSEGNSLSLVWEMCVTQFSIFIFQMFVFPKSLRWSCICYLVSSVVLMMRSRALNNIYLLRKILLQIDSKWCRMVLRVVSDHREKSECIKHVLWCFYCFYIIMIYDDRIWWSYMIIYDDHAWWSYMMNLLMEIRETVSVSDMFGDLWDMFWHHHWGLRNYLEPLTVSFFESKMNRNKKTQNNRTVIFALFK